jgi:hypothetical protein
MNRFTLPTIALGLSVISCLAWAKEDLPETTIEGLVRVESSELAAVYAQPGANLDAYKRVKVVEPYVAFRKNWKRDNQNRGPGLRPTEKDMERIKQDMAAEFMKVFTEELTDGGYPVVDETGPDVLILRPAIVDLNPLAPDLQTAGRVDTYAESAGDMSLYVELYDSETSALIAKGIDWQQDRGTGYMTWSNRVSNRAAADRILKEWAGVLVAALDRAHKASTAED